MHLVYIMSSKMSTYNVKPDCVNFFFTLPQLLFLIILETFSLIVLSLSEGDQIMKCRKLPPGVNVKNS